MVSPLVGAIACHFVVVFGSQFTKLQQFTTGKITSPYQIQFVKISANISLNIQKQRKRGYKILAPK